MIGFVFSFIVYIITSIKSFLGFFIFRPPFPPAYKTEIIKNEESFKEKLLILKRGRNRIYESVEFTTIKHEFIRIPDTNGSFIPAIFIKPIKYYFLIFSAFNLCIIYSHGNSCDIGISFFECVDISLNTNCCVLIYEYPGYGLCSNRKLIEESIYYNIRKVYDHIINELNFNKDEIILYGHSLGTGPSVDLACDSKYPVAAVVLQAPFLSILRTVGYFKKTAFYDYFSNIDKVPNILAPTLVIHGTKDTIVLPEDGEILANNIPKELLYEFLKIEEGDHNDIIKNHKSKVYKKLREFLNHTTKKNFSFDTDSKNEINLEFFKKFKRDEENKQITAENENLNEIIIKNFIESPKQEFRNSLKDNMTLNIMKTTNDEKIELKQEDVIIELMNSNKIEENKEI